MPPYDSHEPPNGGGSAYFEKDTDSVDQQESFRELNFLSILSLDDLHCVAKVTAPAAVSKVTDAGSPQRSDHASSENDKAAVEALPVLLVEQIIAASVHSIGNIGAPSDSNSAYRSAMPAQRSGDQPASDFAVATAASSSDRRETQLVGAGKPPADSTSSSAEVPVPQGGSDEKPATDAERLNLLRTSENVEGLRNFAHTVKDVRLVQQAVEKINAINPPNKLEILREIGKTNSHGAMTALRILVFESDEASDKSLVEGRYKSGELLKLVKDGKADPRDFLRALDWTNQSDIGAQEALKTLQGEAKNELCRSLLDKDPGFGEYYVEYVSTETRVKALEHLATSQPNDPATQKLLVEVAGNTSEAALADCARKQLEKIYTQSEAPEAGKPARSEFLNGKKLKDAVEDLGRRTWGDNPNAPEVFRKWKTAADSFQKTKTGLLSDICLELAIGMDYDEIVERFDGNWKNDRKMHEILGESPELLERYKQARVQEKAVEELRKPVDHIMQGREAALKPYLERFCKEMGIPVPEFHSVISFDANYGGIYQPGKGRVQLLEKYLMSQERPSPELMSVFFHEVCHAEQDSLIIRRLADKLEIGKTPTVEQRESLKRAYLKETAGNTAPSDQTEFNKLADRVLSDKWIDKVLEVRDSRQLSEPEQLRAEKLLQGKREKAELQEEKVKIERKMGSLQSSRKLAAKDIPLSIILGATDREARAKSLLGVKGELHPALKTALEKVAAGHERNAPMDELRALEKAARIELHNQIIRQLAVLERQSKKIYLEREHEVESHDVSRRSSFFGRQLDTQAARGELATLPIGRPQTRLSNDSATRPPRSREEAATRAIDAATEQASRVLSQEKLKGTTTGDTTTYSTEKFSLKIKGKVTEINAIDVVDGKVYLRDAKDGVRYSADPWLDLIKENVTARGEAGGSVDAGAAKELVTKINQSTDAKVAILAELAKKYAAQESLIPHDSHVEASRRAARQTPRTEVIDRTRSRTGARREAVTRVASGATDIRPTNGGGYEVTRTDAHTRSHAARGEELKPKDLEALKREVAKAEHLKPEERARALRALELAANPANTEAREMAARAMREGRFSGLHSAEGRAAGIAIVALALAGWYAYYKMNHVGNVHIPPARVN